MGVGKEPDKKAVKKAAAKHDAHAKQLPHITTGNLAANTMPSEGGGPERGGADVEDPTAGLTSAEAARRLERYGRNEIPEEQLPWTLILLKQFVGLMPFMIEVAALLAIVAGDYTDFALIMLMLIVNGLIGFHEEWKAQISVDALRTGMEAKVPTRRDGEFVTLPVAELVPGDVIFVKGGQIIPADCTWLEGDVLQLDTAALTGEPFPRKIPDPKLSATESIVLSGFVVRQGEAYLRVDKTGFDTEIGQAAALIQSVETGREGLFEGQIYLFTKTIIAITIVDVIIVAWYQIAERGESVENTLLVALSITIASVPIALPMVMTITQAIGAQIMAQESVIVTHLGALQEIASMTVLCSDKTGTLTTAQITILPQSIRTFSAYSQEEVLMFAGMSANEDNKDDPIDSAITKTFNAMDEAPAQRARWKVSRSVGFTPIVKRTITYMTERATGKRFKVSKGLTSKVLKTGDDEGAETWTVDDYSSVGPQVEAADEDFGRAGYKTVGVALAEGDGPWVFIGIIPMIDPPRHDTPQTIYKIQAAGVRVKMITGDHANIAKETARLIGLGTNILPHTELEIPSAVRDATIEAADGFAQVLPKDKQEVVYVLQQKGYVVGMTGDGVNDAPALAQANIGIAVQGATDAARSSADLVLTEPGLSPIFTAIVESRKIFKRLRSYIVYRMASSIQIVAFLTLLIFAYNEELAPLYVILLALLNDLTMLMVAYDNAAPSVKPDIPTIMELVQVALAFGAALTLESWIFYLTGFTVFIDKEYNSSDSYRQSCIYYQTAVAIELVVLSTRTKGFFFLSYPSWQLSVSIVIGLVFLTLLVVCGWLVGHITYQDIAVIWAYDLGWFVAIDAMKVLFTAGLNLSFPTFGPKGAVWLNLPNTSDFFEDDLEKLPLLDPNTMRPPHDHRRGMSSSGKLLVDDVSLVSRTMTLSGRRPSRSDSWPTSPVASVVT